MTQLNFKVVGISDVTDDPTNRFTCTTNDGDSLFVGSENVYSTGHIWQYKDGNWKQVTDNLENAGYRGVNSLLFNNGYLLAGTNDGYLTPNTGKVWKSTKNGWVDSGLTGTFNLNSTIRSLKKVANDIYAAGSFFELHKFNGESWTKAIQYVNNPTVEHSRGNFIHLETDGSAIYASVFDFLSNPFAPASGVIKYDGTNITQIAQKGFGDINNSIISKLCYYNNQLYAGTFNYTSGTQIWRKEQNNNSWVKIVSAGFGDENSYNTFDMKVVDNCLLVSVQNTSGGQVWAYDGSDWERQTINSPVTYNGYFIESFNGDNYLVGQQRVYYIQDDNDVVWLSGEERHSKKLYFTADGIINCNQIGGDRYRFAMPNAGYYVITEGTFTNPVETIVSPLITTVLDGRPVSSIFGAFFASPTVVSSLRAENWDTIDCKTDFRTSGITNRESFNSPGYSGVHYLAGARTWKDPETGFILYLTYTEEGYYFQGSLNWAGAGRQLVSFDNGKTLRDCGYIIKSNYINTTAQAFTTVFNPKSIIKVGDYLYIYYNGDRNFNGDNFKELAVARAPYQEVINAAKNRETVEWKKYFNGSFDQPGFGGSSTELTTSRSVVGNLNPFEGNFFNSKVNKKFSFTNCPILYIDPNLYIICPVAQHIICFSNDGLKQSHPSLIKINRFSNSYGSVVCQGAEYGLIGDEFYHYQLSGPGSLPAWDISSAANTYTKGVLLQETSISQNESEDKLYSKGRYLSKYNINYSIDRDQLSNIYSTMHNIVEQRKLSEASAIYPIPAITSTSAYQNYLRELNWKNIYQSYANSATEVSGWAPNSVNEYYNFRFGNKLHKLYNLYTKEFNRHRLAEDLHYLDGANIFSHIYGPILYNHDMNVISSSNLIIDSLSSTDKFLDKTNLFNSYNTASGVYSSVAVFNDGFDLYNSSIIDAVDLVSLSGAVGNSNFGVIKIPRTYQKKYSSDYMFERTFLRIDSKGSPYSQRLRFDVSRKNLDSSLGYPLSNNFLLPDHKFKLNLNGLVLNSDGTESGGSIGVWIHTQSEDGKFWSFDVNGNWVQHPNNFEGVDKLKFMHSLTMPEVNRQFTPRSALRLKCIDVVTDDSNPIAPLYSLDKDDFYNLELSFNTYNNYCYFGETEGTIPDRTYFLSYGPVHRKNQKYFIEVFSFAQPDRYALIDEVKLVDSTMYEMAVTPLRFNVCPEENMNLSKQQLHSIFEFWNDISGKNHKAGLASRDSTETSGVMFAQGGSRLDYRLNSSWCVKTYYPSSKILTDLEAPV